MAQRRTGRPPGTPAQPRKITKQKANAIRTTLAGEIQRIRLNLRKADACQLIEDNTERRLELLDVIENFRETLKFYDEEDVLLEQVKIDQPSVVSEQMFEEYQSIKRLMNQIIEIEENDDMFTHFTRRRIEMKELWGTKFPYRRIITVPMEMPRESRANNSQVVPVVEKSNDSHDVEEVQQDELDKDFKCAEPARSLIIAAGSAKNQLNLGGKTFPVYLDQNIVRVYKKFTGDTTQEIDSVQELYERLKEIHEAPADQINYTQKTLAVFLNITGLAEKAISGYRNVRDRQTYLKMWKQLFQLYGNKNAEVTRCKEAIRNASLTTTAWKDGVSFLTVLHNSAERLGQLAHNEHTTYVYVWEAVQRNMPDKIKMYCITEVKKFRKRFTNCDQWIEHNPNGNFEEFFEWYIQRTETERTMADAGIHVVQPTLSVFTTSAQQPEQKRKVENSTNNEASKPKKAKNSKNSGKTASNENRKPGSYCINCNENHKWDDCTLTIEERLAAFERDKRCKKCGNKHQGKCTSTRRCIYCRVKDDPSVGNHHGSICFKKFGVPKNRQKGNKSQNESKTTEQGSSSQQVATAAASKPEVQNPEYVNTNGGQVVEKIQQNTNTTVDRTKTYSSDSAMAGPSGTK
jgi:hypothetical protein